jgi:hypothetical protein
MYELVATKIDTKLGGNKEFGTGFLRGTNCGNVQIHHISTTKSRDNSLDTLYGGFEGWSIDVIWQSIPNLSKLSLWSCYEQWLYGKCILWHAPNLWLPLNQRTRSSHEEKRHDDFGLMTGSLNNRF